MSKIEIENFDLTLSLIDQELEKLEKLKAPRNYLGMSQIGEECWRKLFYSFRGVKNREILVSGIRAIEDGFLQEDVMAERLRLLPFIELHTVDPKNSKEQIGFQMLLGHFRGHCDGMIKGVREAPLTWHVWENKTVNEKKYKKLDDLRKDKGEKVALEEWDEIYFAQAQIYMYCSHTTRHFLTVETPGGRNYLSVRTEYQKTKAENIIDKAKSIIFDNWSKPARISDKPEFYKCKWCDYSNICHDGDFPLVNCKTCRYSEPINDGKRKCLSKDEIILESNYYSPCKDHVYNPALLNAKLIEQQRGGAIYQTESDFKFANFPITEMPALKDNLDAIYCSEDLFKKIKNVNNFKKEIIAVQQAFNGEIIETTPEKAWKKKIDKRLKDV